MKEFTDEDLQNFRAFERVRAGGRWNMFDPAARCASGMSTREYEFVLENYSELKEAEQLRKEQK